MHKGYVCTDFVSTYVHSVTLQIGTRIQCHILTFHAQQRLHCERVSKQHCASIPQRHHYNGSAKETQVPESFDSRFPVSESIAFSEFCHAVVVRYVLEFEEGFFTKAILPCHNKPVV